VGAQVEYDSGVPQQFSVGRTQPEVVPFQIASHGQYPGATPAQMLDLLAQRSKPLGATHQHANGVTFCTQVRQQMLTDEAGTPGDKALHTHFPVPC
jgi:hypothetical protein